MHQGCSATLNGSQRIFYEKIGSTLAATLPDYHDEGDDKLIYLLPVR